MPFKLALECSIISFAEDLPTWPRMREDREGLPRELVETFPLIQGRKILMQRLTFITHVHWIKRVMRMHPAFDGGPSPSFEAARPGDEPAQGVLYLLKV